MPFAGTFDEIKAWKLLVSLLVVGFKRCQATGTCTGAASAWAGSWIGILLLPWRSLAPSVNDDVAGLV